MACIFHIHLINFNNWVRTFRIFLTSKLPVNGLLPGKLLIKGLLTYQLQATLSVICHTYEKKCFLPNLSKLKTYWSYSEICSNVILLRCNFSATNFSTKYVLKSGLLIRDNIRISLWKWFKQTKNYLQSNCLETNLIEGVSRNIW